jgi:hypothetical protein
MTNFKQLLTKYSIKKGDGIEHTNTRIDDKKLSLYGGNYHVPDEEYPNFIKSYYNDVIIGNKIEYLTEKQLDTGGGLVRWREGCWCVEVYLITNRNRNSMIKVACCVGPYPLCLAS